MAEIKNRLRVLMAQKSIDEDRDINIDLVSKETGLSRSTVGRWARNQVVQFDSHVMRTFCKYFNCSVHDLFENTSGQEDLDPELEAPLIAQIA